MSKVQRFAGNAKITEESVRALRQLAGRHTPKELARIYGLGLETVRRILRRDTWAWVEDIMPELDAVRNLEPLTQAEAAQAQASLERVLAATGQARLGAEVEKHFRGDAMARELRNPLDE